MRISLAVTRIVIAVACLLLLSGVATAGEKKLMHCFYFTVIDAATDADWQAFYTATDALPSKIPGVSRVWYGKLARPMTLFGTDAETRKKLAAGEAATGPVTQLVRQYGVCMEMADDAALKAYATAPYHKEWMDAYGKVRQPGTSTVNFMGQ